MIQLRLMIYNQDHYLVLLGKVTVCKPTSTLRYKYKLSYWLDPFYPVTPAQPPVFAMFAIKLYCLCYKITFQLFIICVFLLKISRR